MDDIIKYCIKVNGITAYYPIDDKISSKALDSSPEMSMKYGWNNGKVSFVTEDGSYYVTPFCSEVAEALKNLGYTDGSLYVPFSNGDIPSDKNLAEKWEKLCTEARKQFNEREEREKRERYGKIAEDKNLKALPEEVYKMSLAIPEDGLETTWMGEEKSKTRPIMEQKIPESIGTYYQNNGRVSFVDSSGKMFVTPFCSEVTQMLTEAGYQERGLFVPLSNGEQIEDPKISAKWANLCEIARESFNKEQQQNGSGLRM